MGRVTRAAARADPVLADETMTVAETAIAEDTTIVNIDTTASDSQENENTSAATEPTRPPLGEITAASDRLNQASQATGEIFNAENVSYESPALILEDEIVPASENNVVLVLETDKKDQARDRREPNLSASPTRSPKKTIKKGKGIIRVTIKESPYLPSPGSSHTTPTADVKQVEPTIKRDDIELPVSEASKEAATLLAEPLKAGSSPPEQNSFVVDTTPARTPLPAGTEAAKLVTKEEAKATLPSNNTKTGQASKATAVKRKPVLNLASQPISATTKAPQVSSKQPKSTQLKSEEPRTKAVENLTSIFEPQQTLNNEKSVSPSLTDASADQSYCRLPEPKSGIEALDALEDNIEEFERSIANESSPSKKSIENKTWGSRNTNRPNMTGNVQRSVAALNTPPKAKKSTKPPTTSKFQLSSEATTARLKAQREERQKKRNEEEQKRAAVGSNSTKPVIKPVQVRSTVASRARLSLTSANTPGKPATANSTVQRGTGNRNLLRNSTAHVNKQSTLPNRQSSSPIKPYHQAKTVSARPPTTSNVVKPRSSPVHKAKLFATASNTANRNSLPNPAAKPMQANTVHAQPGRKSLASGKAQSTRHSTLGANTGRRLTSVKGKEVFNREKIDREEQEKKAEAARKARIEAAERGRAASKEWAEKKRKATLMSRSQTIASPATNSDGSKKQATSAVVEGADNKENQPLHAGEGKVAVGQGPYSHIPGTDQQVTNRSLAERILCGDTVSQEDAAYILAEMKRIEKVRKGVDRN